MVSPNHTCERVSAIGKKIDAQFRIGPKRDMQTRPIATTNPVPGTIIASVREILKDIINKCNVTLGVDGTEKVQLHHIEWVHNFAEGRYGLLVKKPWEELNNLNRPGHSLLATGIAYCYGPNNG